MVPTPRKKPTPKKTASISLKGSKLEDFLPLLPAEEKLRQCAASGEDCSADDFSDECPTQTTKQNSIRAEFLRYMIMDGCEKSPVHARGINLVGVFIKCIDALDLEAVQICKDLNLEKCFINGSVLLSGASAKNISFEGTKTQAFFAERARISGSLNLDKGFTSTKSVRLSGAHISGNLSCENAKFNETNNALIANRAKIDGDIDLENATAKGTIVLTGTEIGGDITPQGAMLEGMPSLQLRNTKIGGTLIWRSLGFVNGEVDFSGASCKTINTDDDSWMRKRASYQEKRSKDETDTDPQAKKIEHTTKLDNFTFEGFSNLPDNCKPEFWIEFLKQQPEDHLEKNFKPRPWEQLAKVLDSMGYQEEALELRIEKQKLQTSFMAYHEPAAKNGLNFWHWGRVFFRKVLWGPLVGYGYKPGNALVYLFALVILGGIIYGQAAKRGIMAPTHPLVFKEARAGGSIPA